MGSKYEELKIEDVELDMGNPRIKRFLEIYEGEISADQISLALGFGDDGSTSSGTTFFSLKESIRTNQGIIHPIIVNRHEDGRMLVIEGNTRLAIYREFSAKKTSGNWDKIPSIVHKNLSQNQIDAIRLQSHLVGPREWDPYSKAKYLHFLNDAEDMPFNQLVEYCGGRRSEVEQLISAYEDMEENYRPLVEADGEDFDVKRFSGFKELQRRDIKRSIAVTGHSLSDFSKWIHDGLFDRMEHVRQLPQILKNEDAKSIFLSEGSRAALKVFDREDSGGSLKDATLEELCNETRSRLSNLPWEKLKGLKENNDSDEVMAMLGLEDQVSSVIEFITGNED